MNYEQFIQSKSHGGEDHGFDPPDMPGFLYQFQEYLVRWALRKGRAAIFADCGLGKTPMQLVWADQVVRKTNWRVLILTPLAVSFQTVREAEKFGIDAVQRRTGVEPKDRIVVTNYERLDRFCASDFVGCVCDESSILKNFAGATRKAITEFMRRMPYRLLCTATAAPNDYLELGTSSEALGVMERKHMLSHFFTHDGGSTQSWRMKGHARTRAFWQWMTTWAMAIRMPSDIGFSDDGFSLPPLETRSHVVTDSSPLDGYLFTLPAVGLLDQRADLRRTFYERCELAAGLINGNGGLPAIAWCNLNTEGDLLEKKIGGAEQVSGADDDDRKERVLGAFVNGDVRVLVTKPSIGGFGLNMQHCSHQTFFPSHSYEQYYQCVRRSWRFGQKSPVTVDTISTAGQELVLRNLNKKAEQASRMFEMVVRHMGEYGATERRKYNNRVEVPSWLL